MDFVIRNRAVIIVSILFIVVAALVLALTFGVNEAEPPRVVMFTTEEVDFDSGAAHTADAGIAVISGQRQRDAAPTPLRGALTEDDSIRITTQMQGTTNNPDNIWHDADTTHTHGGFTIAVPAMDAESIGILTIPDIGLSARVYEGEDNMEAMEKGIARFRHTSAWEGHIGLSAHILTSTERRGISSISIR